ncbi:hypothetical protein [Burkholderia lata]|uniref:hypothetical protein n=1 Tax=Burkholderia lata (strain ATCC 17760 / DSM 23089 / LMG 22485 / NCIMB 9086 / R18194 / 383) TaxID=482957 RepID=UPI001581A8B3|nr:hypothetical protein [Burkholderia lata]
MAKPVISPEEFIEEVNRRLPEHHKYAQGMRVFLVPRGAIGRTADGYDFEPDNLATTGVVQEVADRVRSEFEVDPSIARPPRR